MARRAVVEIATGTVVNVIEIYEGANWSPPVGYYLLSEIDSQQASIGDTWDGTKLIKAPIPEPIAPLRFETFSHGLPDRITRIEEFLKMLYP